jgi:hypothetical protein
MSLRLLSFLSLIQQRLERTAPSGSGHSAIRSVNYEQGLGRLLFREGGSITLHVPGAASPQGCIKATLTWSQGGMRETRNFFPGTTGHDWAAAADALALAWTAGPTPSGAVERSAPATVVGERTALRREAVAV